MEEDAVAVGQQATESSSVVFGPRFVLVYGSVFASALTVWSRATTIVFCELDARIEDARGPDVERRAATNGTALQARNGAIIH